MEKLEMEKMKAGFDKSMMDLMEGGETVYVLFDMTDGEFVAATNDLAAVLDLATFADKVYKIGRMGVCRMQSAELKRKPDSTKAKPETEDDALTSADKFMAAVMAGRKQK
jgi:trimethylamine:corrinoid methyltransferase-like protein